MGKLVVGTFVTLDGVMQAPGGPDEDRDGGFEHGGWLVPFFDDWLGQYMDKLIGGATRAAARTQDVRDLHPALAARRRRGPMAAKLNAVPKYVASRTLEDADWRNTTVLRGELADEIPRLKEQHDEIQVSGSSDLIQSLLREDLVDELNLLVFPVVLGTGKRLFGDGTIPRSLRLVETHTSPAGVAVHRYERVGDVEYGAVGLETEQATG